MASATQHIEYLCRKRQSDYPILTKLVLAGSLCSIFGLCQGQMLDGVWKSEAYGNVYEITGDRFEAFEVTTRTCVHGFTARRRPPVAPRSDAVFASKGQGPFVISPGTGPDDKLVNHKRRIDRIPRIPAVCTPPTVNTPSGNFDVFTTTFVENYTAFDLRHVDWARIVAEDRAQLTPQTSPNQLFTILESMLKRLGDLHTGLESRQLHRESTPTFRPGTDRVIKGGLDSFTNKGRPALFAVTDAVWAHSAVRNFCKGQLQFTRSSEGMGYLRILSFSDYARFGGDARALESALDTIFDTSALRSLIIDVRLSFGGDDLGPIIAARLTDRRYLAYSIQARSDPTDAHKWSKPDSVYVEPSSRPGFRGPVVELIGPITMSAAETFTQALMGRTPRVTMVGENTQGLFSDPLDRRLPNGWSFSLPNAVYRTAAGTTFDVAGIPPHIRVPVFAGEDVAAGRDPVMTMAVGLLSQR